ncbi:7109_t:CDS:2 [Ambispora leptoticha]|uniref:7109_t:CDS:1 n=1 Tax=Ambispora leptoticha TaxID=144679 RepID=A0A9N9FP63_9GLOM|nr:7109_t:CDS:2 [Ambispora leptoticha]
MESWPTNDAGSRVSFHRKNILRNTKIFKKSLENTKQKFEVDQELINKYPKRNTNTDKTNKNTQTHAKPQQKTPSSKIIYHKPKNDDFSSLRNRKFYSSTSSSLRSDNNSIQNKISSNATTTAPNVIQRLPPIGDLILFYHGYPKHQLIIEGAFMAMRIENGEWVSDYDRWAIRSRLSVELSKKCPPGSLDFLSWQALADLWRRIPNTNYESSYPKPLSPSTINMRTAVV